MKKILVELNEREVNVLKRVLNESEVIVVDHINHDNYKEYIGKTVKVLGDVDLHDLGLTKIPINFTEVGVGYFERNNGHGGYFDCMNNKLTSLKGAPRKVGGSFWCSYNKLTDLVGAPESVGEHFDCSFNQVTSLEGAPEKVGGSFWCEDNKLTTLEGAPESVPGDFDCVANPLKSIKGKPKFIGGEFGIQKVFGY